MATLSFSDLAALVLENYGGVVAQAFTQLGPGNSLLSKHSIMGAIAEAGNVMIGSGDTSDRYSHDWGVHTATATAASFGVNDAYPDATLESYNDAKLEWKRVGIPMKFDNLLRLAGRGSSRGNVNNIEREFMAKVKSVIAAIEAQLATDGTGNGGKDVTGFKAFLSAANTYATINQAAETYWQANIVAGGAAAVSKAMLQDLTKPLFDKGALDDSAELWMPSNQWYRFAALYTSMLRAQPGAVASDEIAPVYADGVVSLPIRIVQSMPTTEIWCIKRSDITLKFLDHNPEDNVQVEPDQEMMHEGVPIGLEQVYQNKDQKSLMLKAYPQVGCEMPRNQGAITGLLA